MKFPKYSEMLKLGKEKLNEMIAPLRANEMKKQAELEICKLESQVAEYEQKVHESLSEYPINFKNIMSALDQVDLTKRRLDQFTKIHREMF